MRQPRLSTPFVLERTGPLKVCFVRIWQTLGHPSIFLFTRRRCRWPRTPWNSGQRKGWGCWKWGQPWGTRMGDGRRCARGGGEGLVFNDYFFSLNQISFSHVLIPLFFFYNGIIGSVKLWFPLQIPIAIVMENGSTSVTVTTTEARTSLTWGESISFMPHMNRNFFLNPCSLLRFPMMSLMRTLRSVQPNANAPRRTMMRIRTTARRPGRGETFGWPRALYWSENPNFFRC